MKKLLTALTFIPAFALAHNSTTHNSYMHALEHNLANPYFAISLLVGLAVLVQVIRKVFKR